MSKTNVHGEPKAHSDLFATMPAPGAQAQLTDYAPLLPEPAHDVEEDLVADPMDDRARSTTIDKLREGTVVTLNTALQGVVTGVDEVTHEDLWHVRVDTINGPTIYTVEPVNEPSIDEFHIVEDGARYKSNYTLYYQLPDGRRTDIKHCAASNEDNLEDEIDVNQYEIFKQHAGANVLRIDGTDIQVCSLNDAVDGDIWFDSTSAREETITVDGTLEATWYLPATAANAARTPSILTANPDEEANTDPDNDANTTCPLGTTDGLSVSETQQEALANLTSLPVGAYTPTESGLVMPTELNDAPAALRVAPSDVLHTALPAADLIDREDTTVRAPDRDAPGTPLDCVTNIIGIGDATAAKLSSTAHNPSPSKSTVREQFEESEMDDIREVPADHPAQQALQEAQKDFEPPETVDRDEFITIQEFCEDAMPLFETAGQYFSRAVADMRAYFEANKTLSEKTLVRIHAGATNARLFDEDGNKLGLLPELMFEQFTHDDVYSATAWDGHSGDSPLPNPEKTDLQYAVTRNLPDALDITGRSPWRLSRDSRTPATNSDFAHDHITFHNAAAHDDLTTAFKNNDLAAGVLPAEVVEYVNALFGINLNDDDTVADLVTIAEDHSVFIEHPSLDVNFAAFPYAKYTPEDADD